MAFVKILAAFVLLAAMAAVHASTGIASMNDAASSLCASLTELLPVASMLMIILAGVIYAAGQMMGAETRARANVWATAALTGALIAVLIVVIAPPVLTAMYGSEVKCSHAATGAQGCPEGTSLCEYKDGCLTTEECEEAYNAQVGACPDDTPYCSCTGGCAATDECAAAGC